MMSAFLDLFAAKQIDGHEGLLTLKTPPAVLHLDGECRPPAITRLIVPVAIDPIKREAERARSHVAQEDLKRGEPLLADRDAAPAIACVGVICGVQAPSLHRAPRAVFSRVRRAVDQTSIPDDFALEAAAAPARASRQVRSLNDGFVAAVALTAPERPASVGDNSSNDRPPREPLSREISKRWHSLILSGRCAS